MSPRQIRLIAELVHVCWQHNERRGAEILLELLGPQVNAQIAEKVKTMMKGN